MLVCDCGPPPEWSVPPPPLPLFLLEDQASTSRLGECDNTKDDQNYLTNLIHQTCTSLHNSGRYDFWRENISSNSNSNNGANFVEQIIPLDDDDRPGTSATDRPVVPDILPDWTLDEVLAVNLVKILLALFCTLSLICVVCITCLVWRRRRKRYRDSSRGFTLVSSSDDDTYSGSVTQPIASHMFTYGNYSRPDLAHSTLQTRNGTLLYGTNANASPFHRPVSQSIRGSSQRLLMNHQYYQASNHSLNQSVANQPVNLLYDEITNVTAPLSTVIGGTRRLPPPSQRPPPPPTSRSVHYSSSGGSNGHVSGSGTDDELELHAMDHNSSYQHIPPQQHTSDEGVDSNGSSPNQLPPNSTFLPKNSQLYADHPLLPGEGGRESGYGTGQRVHRTSTSPQIQSAHIRSIRRARPTDLVPNTSLQWIKRHGGSGSKHGSKQSLAVYL